MVATVNGGHFLLTTFYMDPPLTIDHFAFCSVRSIVKNLSIDIDIYSIVCNYVFLIVGLAC